MKLFSALQLRRPLNRSELLSCAFVNLFATPGLGSVMARRFIAGTAQLVFASIGFALFLGWFIQKMRLFYGQITGTNLPADAGSRLGWWGLALFGVAWVWALVTSIQIVRAAPKESVPPVPPII